MSIIGFELGKRKIQTYLCFYFTVVLAFDKSKKTFTPTRILKQMFKTEMHYKMSNVKAILPLYSCGL